MYIIRQKSDNTVIYAFKEKPVIGGCLKFPLIAYDIKNETHEILKVNTIDGWIPHAYQYDDGWKVKDQKIIDDDLAEKQKPKPVDSNTEAVMELNQIKTDQEGKQLTMAYLDKRLSAIEKILGVN